MEKDLFEILGTFFANSLWHNTYESAVNIVKRDYPKLAVDSDEYLRALEIAYKTSMHRYVKAFSVKPDPKERAPINRDKIMEDLFANYKQYLMPNDTPNGFNDNLARVLVPPELYKTWPKHSTEKNESIISILLKTLGMFAKYIAESQLKLVTSLEGRSRSLEHIKAWKNKYIEFITQERNNFFGLIMAQKVGLDIKRAENIPNIPNELAEKMQERLKKALEEKAIMAANINKYVKLIEKYKAEIISRDNIIASLRGGVPSATIPQLQTTVQPQLATQLQMTPQLQTTPTVQPQLQTTAQPSIAPITSIPPTEELDFEEVDDLKVDE